MKNYLRIVRKIYPEILPDQPTTALKLMPYRQSNFQSL